MNFLGLLKSLDDLLYEVVSWLIFYPMTLWRIIRHPRRTMAYAGSELNDAVAQQYDDTLRPPLFLLLTILLGHAIELALIGKSPIVTDTVGLAGLIDNDTNLIVLRLAMFATLPLILAARVVRRGKHKIDRNTLKAPFYAQCFAAAPFALMLGLAADATQMPWLWAPLVALALFAAAFLWYGLLQVDWFRHHLHIGVARAVLDASISMLECIGVLIVVSALFG